MKNILIFTLFITIPFFSLKTGHNELIKTFKKQKNDGFDRQKKSSLLTTIVANTNLDKSTCGQNHVSEHAANHMRSMCEHIPKIPNTDNI